MCVSRFDKTPKHHVLADLQVQIGEGFHPHEDNSIASTTDLAEEQARRPLVDRVVL